VSAAGIVLAGGRSSRMGTPKAALEWHGSTLLRRVTGLVQRSVDGPVVVVSAPGQELPPLPDGIELVEDAREGRGPLQGLAAGLSAVGDRAVAAYVSSTDVPLLHPRLIRRVLAAFDDDVDVVAPAAGGVQQPFGAVYRVTLLDTVERLIADDRMKLMGLFDECRVRQLALAEFDPDLDSLLNLNEPADYETARARPAPSITVRHFGVVEAATLGEAAAGAGITLDEHVVAALNGDQITRDPEVPLVAGDSVAFLAAAIRPGP
jgi:molybdenum cofactor guanylyltransferase